MLKYKLEHTEHTERTARAHPPGASRATKTPRGSDGFTYLQRRSTVWNICARRQMLSQCYSFYSKNKSSPCYKGCDLRGCDLRGCDLMHEIKRQKHKMHAGADPVTAPALRTDSGSLLVTEVIKTRKDGPVAQWIGHSSSMLKE
ncbi:hypothetical protein CesoFtcFv8_025123 [Champsocephalus esox]|uniref:Uncharacterized protein n=1 Tax=Champsocephalus esox TaxID=159716 RepID=A0AAN8B3U9_9TELE|nr:hypothetical protein CesoFtcFv8_025123 [Champsocephalus esox]